jgi:hypothetical protein
MRELLPAPRLKFIQQLLKNLDSAYVPSNRGYGYGSGGGWGDNSCTQYAILGYHAACLLGADVKSEVFKREATRLIDQFCEATEHKPVPYETDDKKTSSKATVQPGGWGYSLGREGYCMQFAAAGMGSLAICIDQLKIRGELSADFEESMERKIAAAAAYVAEVYSVDGSSRDAGIGRLDTATDGWGAYYNLYSVERGASLAKIRQLCGKVDWYAIGSRLLIEQQNDDGSWGVHTPLPSGVKTVRTHQLINTCMAILFLRRAALPVLTDHKTRDKSPITGEPRKKDAPKEEPRQEGEGGK